MTTDLEQEARWYAKRVIITPMQTGYQGLYDANTETIYIADDLTPTQYRCVLAHEISHAKHRDRGGHADRYTEQRADIEASPNAHKPSDTRPPKTYTTETKSSWQKR